MLQLFQRIDSDARFAPRKRVLLALRGPQSRQVEVPVEQPAGDNSDGGGGVT